MLGESSAWCAQGYTPTLAQEHAAPAIATEYLPFLHSMVLTLWKYFFPLVTSPSETSRLRLVTQPPCPLHKVPSFFFAARRV
jgi:hypothetical protein